VTGRDRRRHRILAGSQQAAPRRAVECCEQARGGVGRSVASDGLDAEEQAPVEAHGSLPDRLCGKAARFGKNRLMLRSSPLGICPIALLYRDETCDQRGDDEYRQQGSGCPRRANRSAVLTYLFTGELVLRHSPQWRSNVGDGIEKAAVTEVEMCFGLRPCQIDVARLLCIDAAQRRGYGG
jgi:hypothetical protein